MINNRQAYNLIKQQFSEYKILYSIEFPDFYAFNVEPKNIGNRKYIGAMMAVSKKDGKIGQFNPLMHKREDIARAMQKRVDYKE